MVEYRMQYEDVENNAKLTKEDIERLSGDKMNKVACLTDGTRSVTGMKGMISNIAHALLVKEDQKQRDFERLHRMHSKIAERENATEGVLGTRSALKVYDFFKSDAEQGDYKLITVRGDHDAEVTPVETQLGDNEPEDDDLIL
ncbi:MAG: hypothetical protein N4A47_00110 [Clostridia bacterium]|jgi:hypothetical protein|nr:hypothetical protein [Clostridia bacterium]